MILKLMSQKYSLLRNCKHFVRNMTCRLSCWEKGRKPASFEKISHSAGCHKGNRKVKYCVLESFKDRADNADAIRKLSELFHTGKELKYRVIVGDSKT